MLLKLELNCDETLAKLKKKKILGSNFLKLFIFKLIISF